MSLLYTMTNSNRGSNRANKSDRTYNKLVFLWVTLSLGAKLRFSFLLFRRCSFFFLLLLSAVFFFSFLLITKTDILFMNRFALCGLLFFFLKCTQVYLYYFIYTHKKKKWTNEFSPTKIDILTNYSDKMKIKCG